MDISITNIFLFLSEKKLKIMNFYKLWPWAILPSTDQNQSIEIRSPQDFDIPRNEIFTINLGLILLKVPDNNVIKLLSSAKFKLIVKYWLPSNSTLEISLVTPTPLHIKKGDILCHLQLIPISTLLPGKKQNID
jgi:hypothetical protein